jgi:hypothetical protein
VVCLGRCFRRPRHELNNWLNHNPQGTEHALPAAARRRLLAQPDPGLPVFRRGHALYVPADLHRKREPPRPRLGQLGAAPLPFRHGAGGAHPAMGRPQAGGPSEPGIFHHGRGTGLGITLAAPARLCRRTGRRLRHHHRQHAVDGLDDPEPSGVAGVPASSGPEHLSLAALDPPPADCRADCHCLWLLRFSGRTSQHDRNGHAHLCGHPAVCPRPDRRTVLAQSQPDRLCQRSCHRHDLVVRHPGRSLSHRDARVLPEL